MKKKTLTKRKIELKGFKPFEIWNENGEVKQNGWFGLPEVLIHFGNTQAGMFEAGAFIAGMAECAAIFDGRYTNVKPELTNQ